MQIVQDMKSPEQVVWDFYGTPLKAMRRIQLWRLCDIKKIPYPKGCTKDILISILESQEMMLQANGQTLLTPPPGLSEEHFWKLINGPRKEYNDFTGGMAEGQTNVDAMQDILEGRSHFETTGEPNPDYETPPIPEGDPSTMSWHELKKEAKSRGIPVPNTLKRPQLEELLRGHAA